MYIFKFKKKKTNNIRKKFGDKYSLAHTTVVSVFHA